MESSWIELAATWASQHHGHVMLLLFGLTLAAVGSVYAAASRAARAPQVAADRAEVEAEVAQPTELAEPAEAVSSTPQAPVAEPPRAASPEAEAQPELEAVSVPAAEPVAERVAPAALPEPVAPPVRLRDRLRLTSESLVGRLGRLLSGRTVDAAVLEELEMMLFEADLGVKTADSLLDVVRSEAAGGDEAAVRGVLRAAILEKLRRVESDQGLALRGSPHVILVLGVNGAGKTTTIGKLAARYRAADRAVILGAGDTFRAAAREQLEVWGARAGCDVIAGRAGSDPSAVAFDTVQAAGARGIDVAIIDTAGRLQTKQPLMEELGKMVRVIGKALKGAPHEVLLVLDATTGQNAISQARLFTEVAGVTGLVLTKLDGTAKGGVLIGLADEFGIPVRYVGVGETVADLRDFSAEEFVDAVFEDAPSE